MILPSTEERIAEAWRAGIPHQYRLVPGKDKGLSSDRFESAAIIQPPPPVSLIQKFLLNVAFRRQHLRPEQVVISHSGRRKDILTSAEV